MLCKLPSHSCVKTSHSWPGIALLFSSWFFQQPHNTLTVWSAHLGGSSSSATASLFWCLTLLLLQTRDSNVVGNILTLIQRDPYPWVHCKSKPTVWTCLSAALPQVEKEKRDASCCGSELCKWEWGCEQPYKHLWAVKLNLNLGLKIWKANSLICYLVSTILLTEELLSSAGRLSATAIFSSAPQLETFSFPRHLSRLDVVYEITGMERPAFLPSSKHKR